MIAIQELTGCPESIQRAALKGCTPGELDTLRRAVDELVCEAAEREDWTTADLGELTECYIREAQGMPSLLARILK